MSDVREERARIADVLRRALASLDAAPRGDWSELSALTSALEDAFTRAGDTPATATAAPATAAGAGPSRFVHDMRSAGGTLLTWCHLLRRGRLTAEQTAHGIEVMERTARRQLALVEQLAADRRRHRAPSVAAASTAESVATASDAAVAGG